MTNTTQPAPSIADAVRELSKWLNEQPNRPVDKTCLAVLCHAFQDAQPAAPVGMAETVVYHECPCCKSHLVNGQPATIWAATTQHVQQLEVDARAEALYQARIRLGLQETYERGVYRRKVEAEELTTTPEPKP